MADYGGRMPEMNRWDRFCWHEGEIVLSHEDISIPQEDIARANLAIDELIQELEERKKCRK